ncbi:Imm49 family immunity protein [Melittangium boletus]|uniref:Imm49 family immunity protein n=1 Tax=Melittangium boletus TaxID=83453 RepID=UPI003DA4D0E3
MMHDPLGLAEENYTYQLRGMLERAQAGDTSPEMLAGVAFSYRILGTCALLRRLDTEQFARLLRMSGLVRLQMLVHASPEALGSLRVLTVSHDVGFCAALAAGDLDTATRIAEHSRASYNDAWEHEEDFLFFRFLQQLLLVPDDLAVFRRMLERWLQVVEGEPTVYFTVCRALMDADQNAFVMALEELVETRKDNLRKYRRQLDFDREIDATEGKVYINGLALVRLSQSRGFIVPERLELLPRYARTATCGALQDDAWLRL